MKDVFPLTAPGTAALWVMLPIAALLLAGLALIVALAAGSRRGAVEVSAEGLRLRVPMYGRTIPWTSLELGAARVVDLTAERDHGLKWRTNGIGLPRYNVGWFKLRNGDRALAAVTDPQRVLMVPTREGFTLLVSVDDPQRLVESLRRHAGGS